MIQPKFNHREPLRFKHFSRKRYALFSVLGRLVLIGTLSVASLEHAQANGISVRTDLTGDSLARPSVLLEEVQVTGSRAPLTAVQTARVVGVITREEIGRTGVTTVNDLLKLVSSVDVRQRGGFGVQTDISINGGTFDQITLMLNGVDISNPQTGHNTAFFPVDLQDIERIEILEGASSRALGVQAFNGVINIVTHKSPSSLRARVDAGSYGTVGGAASVNLALGNPHQLFVGGGYRRSDGGTPHSDFERSHGMAQYNGTLSSFVNLEAQLGVNKQRYGANTFYTPRFNNQYENATNGNFSLRANFHDAKRMWEIRPMVYANKFLDHYQLKRGVQGAAAGENYHNLTVLGATLNASLHWQAGLTAVGADVRRENLYSTAYGELLNAAEQKNIRGSERLYERQAKRTNTNLYAEHNVFWGGLTLSAGLLANTNSALHQGLNFYPGLDLAYKWSNGLRLYTSVNQALRMPTYTDLYTNNAVTIGDVNLKPEKKTEVRVGATWQKPEWEVRLTGFYSQGRDMIDWVYEKADDKKYHALNIGKLNNMGYSVETTFHPATWNASCPITQVKFAYSFIHQHHETDRPIFRSLYALEYLRHKFAATIDHNIWQKLSAQWTVRWQQRMNGYTPYWKLDGKLTWNDRLFDVYVAADNLTAHRYVDYSSVPQPGLWIMSGVKLHLAL